MATPPAPTSASVEAARIRAAQGQFDNSLDAVVRLVIEGNKTKAARRESLQRGVTKIDEFIGKGQNDAFVKLADLNTTYGRALQAGNVQPIDKIKYLVQIMELQKDVNVSLNKGNEQRLKTIISQAETETGGRIKDPATNRRIFELYFQDASASAYNPTLTGDIDYLTKATDVEDPLSFGITGDVGVMQQYNDRLAAQQSLNNAAQVIVTSFGPDALKNLSSAAGSGQVSETVQNALNGIPNAEFDRLRTVAEKIPGLADLKTRRDAYDKEIAKLNTELSGDLVVQAQSAMSAFNLAGAEAKPAGINMKARIVALPKFQQWAASNGLKIGSSRPATMPGDKQLAGYDSATDTVYVPGPDDERAFRIYHRQISLRPERQILPRRGLEARRVLSVQVGEPSPDAAKVNKDGNYRTIDGKYATDAEVEAVRAKNTPVESATTKDGVILKMKDGSFQLQPLAEGAEPVALAAGDARLTGAAFKPSTLAITDEDLGISEAKRPAPSATRTITGRETALLPSDPEGATVLETADGRRIVIPKEQTVDVSEVAKAAPLEGETTRRGIRMPFAALRARRAGVGKTPTEAEVETLPEAGAPSLRVPETGVGLPKRGTPTRQEMLGQNIVPMPAPAPVATKPEAAATPTPGEEAGKVVRDAIGAPTGATAPRPVGIADGGSQASVPAMPMSALDRIRSMRFQAPPASPAQAPTVSTTEEPVAVVGQPSGAVRTPMTPKATARAEKVVERAGVTASERLDAARRKRIADAAAARKREQDAYMKEFMAVERGEQPPPTMAPYVP
jgi:hypothetical protein